MLLTYICRGKISTVLYMNFNKLHFVFALFISFQLSAQTEKHFKKITQLTFGGDNAEAYFSPDGEKFCFQSNNKKWGLSCDQIFMMNLSNPLKDSTDKAKMINTGIGRTTCSFYMPDSKNILYASTHLSSNMCPESPVVKDKYVWGIFSSFDIFVSDESGNSIKQLTNQAGYDAEATVSPLGDKIVFTSTRNGDLDLYTMNIDGSDVKQITFGLGYDGGAFFSPNGKQLVFRSSRPQTELEINEYKELLAQDLVAPTNMEIYTCNVDGSNLKQITFLGKANWCPFFHHDGKKIIFSSNYHSQRGYDFQLYMINTDGTGIEKISNESNFNAFPMFSPDGKKLLFSSNRNNGGTRDTNIFIAEWGD